MPETAVTQAPQRGIAPAAALQRSPSKRNAFLRGPPSAPGGVDSAGERDTRTTDEKQALLGRYLNNVEDLVEDLKETAPFGATVY